MVALVLRPVRGERVEVISGDRIETQNNPGSRPAPRGRAADDAETDAGCRICGGQRSTPVGAYRGLDANGDAYYDRMPCPLCRREAYAEHERIEARIQGEKPIRP